MPRVVTPNPGQVLNLQNPINWAHPLNRGRKAWWRVVKNPGWRGGAVLRDLVRGSGKFPHDVTLHGTLGTNVTWGGPKGFIGSEGTLLWDGSSGYGSFSDQGLPSGASAFTVAWTFKFLAAVPGGSFKDIGSFGRPGNATGAANGQDVIFGVNHPGSFDVYFLSNYGTDVVTNSIGPSVGVIYRVVITYSGTQVSFWQNAIPDGNNPQNLTLNTVLFNGALGCRWDGNTGQTEFINAPVDDVSIWDRQFTQQDVSLDFQLSRKGYPGVLNWISPVDYPFPSAAAAAFVPYQPWYGRGPVMGM